MNASRSIGRRPRGSLSELRAILAAVAAERHLPVETIADPQDWRKPVRAARWAFIDRAYATDRFSMPALARFLGQHHTTIKNALDKQGAVAA